MDDTTAAALYFNRKRHRALANAETLELAANTVAAAAGVGTEIGAFNVRNGAGTYTFTLPVDADGQFTIDGDVLEVAGALTPGRHTIVAEADNGVTNPVSAAFAVVVA